MRANIATIRRRTPWLFATGRLLTLFREARLCTGARGVHALVLPRACDRNCLIGFLDSYMDALAHKDPGRARLASHVRFTENDVELPVG